jgi:hypothetical protein
MHWTLVQYQYGINHCLRDVAKPGLETDSHAKGSCGGLSGGSGRSHARCWLNAARTSAQFPKAQAEAVARDVGLD